MFCELTNWPEIILCSQNFIKIILEDVSEVAQRLLRTILTDPVAQITEIKFFEH